MVFFYYAFTSYDFALLLQSFNISLFFGGVVRFITQTAKRESRFYFAKGYCKIITPKQNIFDKMKFLFLALDSYNKYLGRNTKYEIKPIGIIYSKFLSLPLKEKDRIITLVCRSLNKDNFELANYLSLFSGVPDTELFTRESILQKLKSIGIFLAATIPIIISLIEFIFGLGK